MTAFVRARNLFQLALHILVTPVLPALPEGAVPAI
jgi:hypothetical protein